MYKTTNNHSEKREYFDWDSYFSNIDSEHIASEADAREIFFRLRELAKEDSARLGFTLSKLFRGLLRDSGIGRNPDILELGAATGFLTRLLMTHFGGRGVLVDKNDASFKAYDKMNDPLKNNIEYVLEDIFKLSLDRRFDIVCSFGLIEHFIDKAPVLDVHRKFASPNGNIIILVPLDSILTRMFLEVHPELNLGYRELLTIKELKQILERSGLHVAATGTTSGYAYDIAGAICHI